MTETFKPFVQEIAPNVHLLNFGEDQKLYLIGTAHVSPESVSLVEKQITDLKPDTICVELDEDRYQRLTNKANYDDLDLIKIIRQKKFFSFIGQMWLASFQQKIAKKTGSEPGKEFKVACQLALSSGARIVLADRNIGITLKRAWRLTRWRDKFKLVFSFFGSEKEDLDLSDIEALKSLDAITNLIKHFSKELPLTKKVLIDERDLFLTNEIRNNLGKVTVAVVGAGHVPGMLENFKKEIKPELLEEINFVPSPSKVSKIIPWLIPLIIIFVFAFGFFYGRREMAGEVLVFWILANGLLSALGCLLALAHPLTILVGFIAAPLTSLNPTIGAGLVTALVQTFLVKPRIKDFAQFQKGEISLKDWWSNRLAKIILVFILSSLGSAIGTFVALPVLKKFFI